MPIEQLWDEQGFFGERLRYLMIDDIRILLKQSVRQFIEVNIGSPLRWVPLEECFDYWKWARPNISENDHNVALYDFPGGYFFAASEWEGRSGDRLIVLEISH